MKKEKKEISISHYFRIGIKYLTNEKVSDLNEIIQENKELNISRSICIQLQQNRTIFTSEVMEPIYFLFKQNVVEVNLKKQNNVLV